MASTDYDLVIVGLGSGGMVAAEFATRLGIKVAAVEAARVGGDCLWTGCVPSKALLASAKAAHTIRHADRYGIEVAPPRIDSARVFARVHAIQQRLASTSDSPRRFRELGVDLRLGRARIAGPHEVIVGDTPISTRFILLCTGSRPARADVPGLAEVGYLTSETVFELERAPRSLVVLGGGPIAIELGQAFARLGTATTVLQRGPRILMRDEPELVARLAGTLRAEGVDLRMGVTADRVVAQSGAKIVHVGDERLSVDAILIAAGRMPNVEGLGLAQVGVRCGALGIEVDRRMRTAVASIYAAGDVAGRFAFTHSAGYEAARAVRNMFFPGSSGGEYEVPWCTFTDPELAHVGLTEGQARERWGDDVAVWRHELADSDRARTDGSEVGAIHVVTRKGTIVGGHVLAANAGEIVNELALALHRGLDLADLGRVIHVYPTYSIGIQQLGADAAYERAERYKFLVRSRAAR